MGIKVSAIFSVSPRCDVCNAVMHVEFFSVFLFFFHPIVLMEFM
jgi:hypothetical protein